MRSRTARFEIAEVVLHGAEVGEQGARGVGDLQEALAHAAGIEERERPAADARYLGIDLRAPPLQLRYEIGCGADDRASGNPWRRPE
jgi:hypothetical protein